MTSESVKFGIRPHGWIAATEYSFHDLVQWVQRAERKGFDSIHVADRLLSRVPPMYESTMNEATTTLNHYAAHTNRINLGPLVLVVPFRHPIHIAKIFGSMDVASNGRMILGVGTGWNPHEFRSLGVDKSRRGTALEEGVEIVKKLWTEDHVDYDGEVYSLEDVTVDPKPVQDPHPPIWFGNFGPKLEQNFPPDFVLERIGRLGDGWAPLPYSTELKRMMEPWAFGEAWETIEAAAREHGRDPDDIEIIYPHWGFVMKDEEAEREECTESVQWWFDGTYEEAKETYLIGSPDEIVEQIEEATADLPRVDRFIFTPFNYDDKHMDRWADEVAPRLEELF